MSSRAITPISIREGDKDKAKLAQDLGACFARYGFAVISEHGIDQKIIDDAFDRTKRFFALPEAVKRKYIVPNGGGQRGYTAFGIEQAKGADRPDLKEFWHVGREMPKGHRLSDSMLPNVTVSEIPDFNAKTYALFQALDALGLRVLSGIAIYLGLAPNFFDDKVKEGNSILRALHYPPVKPGASAVRAGAHEDINVITLLLGAEEAGLQLLDKGGNWLDIDPPPGCVVCNIGDMLQRSTNHVLPSTTHRVVNPAPERAGFSRYSLPFFLHYASDYLIETLPGCATAANPNRYAKPITADDYLKERLAEIKLV